MSRTDDIISANEKPQWDVPVDPECDASYWRARAEKAEAENARITTELHEANFDAYNLANELETEQNLGYTCWQLREHYKRVKEGVE